MKQVNRRRFNQQLLSAVKSNHNDAIVWLASGKKGEGFQKRLYANIWQRRNDNDKKYFF